MLRELKYLICCIIGHRPGRILGMKYKVFGFCGRCKYSIYRDDEDCKWKTFKG